MKKAKGFPCVLLAVLASLLILGCSSLGAGGGDGNLAANPDFESGQPGQEAPGWMTWQKLDGSVFRVVRDPAIAHEGSQYVSIQQTASDQLNTAIWFQQMPAKAGTTYRFSFWIRTDDVQPLTRYDLKWPKCCGTIAFLDANHGNLPPYPQSANVFMTHDWQKFEISFTTPKGTAFVQISLVLENAVGTVFFDSASLYVSQYHAVQSPPWLPDTVGYNLGPWEFSWLGNGNAFRGITAKLPDLDALGVNLLYLLPIWEKEGWYNISDHFAVFRKYGTEQDFRAMVAEAHRRGMRVILDLAGTIGVPRESKLVTQHPEWFILGGFRQLYHSWGDLCGLDQNRHDVQQYFVDVAKYYVERLDVDGYRCDMVMASPYGMYEKIRSAVQQIKPDAILIAEDNTTPIDHETAFDATYDYPFLDRISSLISDPHEAAETVRWLVTQGDSYPPGAVRMRYLEGHDHDYTIASRCGLAFSRAFATFLLTIDGLPMIYNGEEVGNKVPQLGWWSPLIDWNNPDAARYRETYTTLIGIRANYPALRRGSLIAITSSDNRVAAFARVLPGEQTVLTVINFSDSAIETRLDLSPGALEVSKGSNVSDLLEDARFAVSSPRAFTLTLKPYQSRILLVLPSGEGTH